VPVLDQPTWRARRAAHEARVDAWVGPHLERRRGGVAHPVEDFLFTYYSHRPAQLRRWHPGAGVVLAGADPADFGRDYVRTDDQGRDYVRTDDQGRDYVRAGGGADHGGGGAVLDADAVLARRRESVPWIRDLLVATAGRAAQLSCFGMHEWAMVYRQGQDDVRHRAWPLRLGAAGTAAVVDRTAVRCTHFDAYRFFTPAARPLNQIEPTRDRQAEMEQPGCLHANMDVYRWAYKLSPLVPSELVADCFELAREIRTLDMRASPYDLAGLGLPPLAVETPDGRAEYVAHQRDFARRAAPLRERLIAHVTPLAVAMIS
jgi:hypothetical protein